MATTMLITFIVNNHVNDADNAKAEAWEAAFIDYLKNYSSVYFNFSFSSEVTKRLTNTINLITF